MDARMQDLVSAIEAHSGLSRDDIRQAGEHGADAGWGGFTYTSDGADFTRANRGLIWELLAEEAESMGAENVAAYVSTFGRSDMADDPESFDCLRGGRWRRPDAGSRTTRASFARPTRTHYARAARQQGARRADGLQMGTRPTTIGEPCSTPQRTASLRSPLRSRASTQTAGHPRASSRMPKWRSPKTTTTRASYSRSGRTLTARASRLKPARTRAARSLTRRRTLRVGLARRAPLGTSDDERTNVQDLDQGSIYLSSRLGELRVSDLAVTHAERALNALRREHGGLVDTTPLGRALLARTALCEARADDRLVAFGDASSVALRGTDGRVKGYARRGVYRKVER
jgi:hypothetical protein